MTILKKRLVAGSIVALATAMAAPAVADHSWNGYHWQTDAGTATPTVFDNTSATWKSKIALAISDWNRSGNIQSEYVSDGTNTSRRCSMTEGTIQVCNDTYGFNGWVGIATISVSGGHIVAGSTKLNDSYFNLPTYDSDSWRQLVACQEIGHDYGLAHQNEDFNTDITHSCMEYTNLPEGNERPDDVYVEVTGDGSIPPHDFAQLAEIYHSGDGATPPPPDTGGNGNGKGGGKGKPLGIDVGNTQAEWGQAIGYDAHGRPNVFKQVIRGYTVLTHVTWAIGEGPKGAEQGPRQHSGDHYFNF